ncbi:MAG: ABC transporter permease [Lachnospiraceae bacterium]
MFELIKIDWKKYNLKRIPLYFFFVYIIVAGMTYSVLNLLDGALIDNASSIIDLLLKTIFLIVEAVLITTIVISEFKDKTILLLYSYPIGKQKLIIAKVLLVVLLSLAGILCGQVILNLMFFGLHQFIPDIRFSITPVEIFSYGFTSVMVVFLGLLPMCIGLVKYSTVATMVTSIIILLVGSNSGLGMDNLIGNTLFTVTLGIIGLAATIYSINNLLKRDMKV